MVVGSNNISQAADVRMTQQTYDGGLACGSDFLGLVGSLPLCSGVVSVIGGLSGDDFACNLDRANLT
jgi:hypothetical protein